MSAYYNEFDPYAAAWLRNLIAAGHIAPGEVDERSIEEVTPGDLRGFRQCHFFAGLGGWSYALRLAGWPDDQPVWTGSCPCQPFSAAGKGTGFTDERHLWPAFGHLVNQCRPAVVLGEQVAAKNADAWIDLVHADLENMGYAFGCVPFPAAGIGAPHIRDRNYWVGYASDAGLQERERNTWLPGRTPGGNAREAVERAGVHALRVGNADSFGAGRYGRAVRGAIASGDGQQRAHDAGASGSAGGLAHASDERRNGEPVRLREGRAAGDVSEAGRGGCAVFSAGHAADHSNVGSLHASAPAGPTNSHWAAADWLACRDGKWRPVEPGTFPLAHGVSGRVGRLRAYGNAIVAPQAAEFIRAVMECRPSVAVDLEAAA